MQINRITENKKQFLDLLLLADEQENMIDKYLSDGDMFALYDDNLKGICVVVAQDNKNCELKNIAIYPKDQTKGYGKALVNFILDYYKKSYETIFVGTGETAASLAFYKSCGFTISHRISNFFTDNYDHLIIENDQQLVDMIYLKQDLQNKLVE